LEKNDRIKTQRRDAANIPTFRSKTTSPADWESVDAQLVMKAVATLAARDGALRLGYTRDGGAYAVGFYGDGDPFTKYIAPGDDIDGFFREVIEYYGK
jgi:hypothetical protein